MKDFLFACSRHRDQNSPDSWWDKPSGLGMSINALNAVAAACYLVLALAPLAYVVVCNPGLTNAAKDDKCLRLGIFAYVAAVALLPTMWQWVHASAFFEWANARFAPGSADKKPIEAERFRLNTEYARTLWAGVLALYGASFLGVRG